MSDDLNIFLMNNLSSSSAISLNLFCKSNKNMNNRRIMSETKLNILVVIAVVSVVISVSTLIVNL